MPPASDAAGRAMADRSGEARRRKIHAASARRCAMANSARGANRVRDYRIACGLQEARQVVLVVALDIARMSMTRLVAASGETSQRRPPCARASSPNGIGQAALPLREGANVTTPRRSGSLLRRSAYAALLTTGLVALEILMPVASAGIPEGVWLLEPNSALQIFDCNGLLCGWIVWLRNVHDPTGQIQRDKENPDPALRQRLLCGLTMLWALRPVGADTWADGWFYNPDDGRTYRVDAELRSSDTIVARIYLGIPLFGETRTLRRVPRLSSEGWC